MNIQGLRFADEIRAYLVWDKFLLQAVVNTVNEPSGFVQDLKFLD